MGMKLNDIVEGDSVKVWWLLATAALYELGREFIPKEDIIKAIMEGDIQLLQSEAEEGQMPSFKADIKEKSSGVVNGH
ncbi:hypothetical protein LCGC14_0593260 [marine sediment metagenome]|uniref:Uncharacterized protein n=1 Tax=marine sediment metagenome TaxID=412755 RepID=A0A0F9ULA2_9ZZZZ